MNRHRRAALTGLIALGAAPRAFAQRDRVRTVGYLATGSSGPKHLAAAMARLGWIDGGNVRYLLRRVEEGGSDADVGAGALVRAAPDVLVGYGAPFVRALARATRAIPIVCGGISDPVTEGIAKSVQHPGTNVTGLSFGLSEAAVIQIGMLRALLPGLRRVVFVTIPGDPTDRPAAGHQAACDAVGIAAELVRVASLAELDRMFGSLRHATEAAWLAMLPRDVSADATAAAAIRSRIATHALDSTLVRAGALMSYWLVHSDTPGKIATLIDKVFRGENPARIPFEQPDKTEFSFNRATAAALGLRVTPDILLRATEVIG